jgi:hypothetical protein
MLPLILLKAAQGHPVVGFIITVVIPLPKPNSSSAVVYSTLMLFHFFLQLVELKNGETYNGHLIQCDSWMNMHVREVICTAKVRIFSTFFFSQTLFPAPH